MAVGRGEEEVVEGGVVITRLPVPGSSDTVVLLDPERRSEGVLPWHPYKNILRVTPTGVVRWRAELVSGEKCWIAVRWSSELTAVTYSYVCTLDADTGRITQTTFTK